MRTRAGAGTAVDTAAISSSFAFEEPKVQTLLDAPTTDLVREFLVSLTAKAQEFDAAKAEKLRTDVELENTLRNNETRVKSLKAASNKNLKEIEELRKSLSVQGRSSSLNDLSSAMLTVVLPRKYISRVTIRTGYDQKHI